MSKLIQMSNKEYFEVFFKQGFSDLPDNFISFPFVCSSKGFIEKQQGARHNVAVNFAQSAKFFR